jgi:trehalose 6-phosphate phosphatase
VSGIVLAGTYGIELQDETGETSYRVEHAQIRPALEALKPRWEKLMRGKDGFFLEDKDWTLAMHARFAEEEQAAQVLGEALETATLLLPPERFRILGGHRFLEVAPQMTSKRETVVYLLNQFPLPGARLLYIGDDDKDEEAFPVIHDHGGLAIKVRQPSQASHATAADFFFDSPSETLSWLRELL